ncbi:MAG: mechanosensitive ion channel [Alphaproteobacteria bacterium]|nr:mechanosensitive ion channel [Alphaproteobacteria bacterium]
MDGLNAFGLWLAQWPSLLDAFMRFLGLGIAASSLPWTIVQVAIIALAYSLALVGVRLLATPLERLVSLARLRPAPLRIAAVILARQQAILFVILLWLGVAAMRAATWGSRSYFLTLVASLVSSWVAITIASRVIRNRTLARLIEIGGWVLVTLGLLGVLPEAMELMDQVALPVGEWRISLLLFVEGVVVIWVLLWMAGWAGNLLERQLRGIEDISPTHRVLIGTVTRTGLVVLALLVGLDTIGVDFSALTFVSGAIGVGLGFGLQKVVSNFVSGIILLTDKSIKPGDIISVGDSFGWISSLNARYVSVFMYDGREVLIPNEDLITNPVENWSFGDTFIRVEIKFGVAYDSDPHRVREIAIAAAERHPRVVKGHAKYANICHITDFGESSIDFVLRFYISDPDNGLTNVRGEVFLNLWDAFKAENITIPFPQREVTVRSQPGPAAPPAD